MTDRNLSLIQTDTISDRIYRFVRESLRSGTYAPGEKITHRRVASNLNVSVTPVREAITRLISEGSLSMKGPKTIVALELNQSEFQEISEIRVRLEGWAAELATQNATNELTSDLRKLHQAYCAVRQKNDGKAILEANSRFHFRLYESANAPKLVQIIDSLWVSSGPTIGLLSRKLPNDGDGQKYHEAALEALQRGDAVAVRQAISDDIITGREKILKLLDAVSMLDDDARNAASS